MFAFISAVAPVGVHAFAGRAVSLRPATVAASTATVTMVDNVLPVFTKAMSEFNQEYAPFAKRGWGATVQAEVRSDRCACHVSQGVSLEA
jgi:hypothetical protein